MPLDSLDFKLGHIMGGWMSLLPMFYARPNLLQMHPMPMRFGCTGDHRLGIDLSLFNLAQELGFRDGTNRLGAPEKSLLHVKPVGGHFAFSLHVILCHIQNKHLIQRNSRPRIFA